MLPEAGTILGTAKVWPELLAQIKLLPSHFSHLCEFEAFLTISSFLLTTDIIHYLRISSPSRRRKVSVCCISRSFAQRLYLELALNLPSCITRKQRLL